MATKPFTFFVGPDAKPIVVHGGLFRDISEPLHARIPQTENGNSDTWQRDSDTISDVEWSVFAGLVEYAYTGDYARSLAIVETASSCLEDDLASDKPDVLLSVEENEHNPEPAPMAVVELAREEPVILPDPFWGESSGKKKKKKKTLWSDDEEAQAVIHEPTPSQLLWAQFTNKEPRSRTSKGQTPSHWNPAAPLYHAKLCVLANRYMADSLQHLCLTELYFALTDLEADAKIEPQEIDSILDLVEYVYLEEGVQGIPQLKEIVLFFTAAKLNVLRQDPRFRCMLEAIGSLGADIVYEISKSRNWR